MSNIQQRVITALVLLFAAIIGLSGSFFAFATLFGVVVFFCLWEFFDIVLSPPTVVHRSFRKTEGVIIGLLPFGMLLWQRFQPEIATDSLVIALTITLLFSVFILELFLNADHPFAEMGTIFLGFFYIGLPFGALLLLQQNYGNAPIIGLWLLIAAFDIAAYFVGSRFGKTPLFPRISPKKTWEGVAGGGVLLVVFFFLMPFLLRWLSDLAGFSLTTQITETQWIGIAVLTLVFGNLGDLIESMLKRSFHVKDSSNLLPGHGGFLDRFDSFFFPLPFILIYLLFL